VAWVLAPAGSPVPAVGELIINILPGPLVNFGKETLGRADKPVLLAIIILAVLIICGLAGQLELRRRFGGAAVFALVAVLGLVGIATQPEVTFTAYVPTIVGLLLGYMILSTLIGKLQQWRSLQTSGTSGEAQSAARRNFLAWTIVIGGRVSHCCDQRPAARQRIVSHRHGAGETEASSARKNSARASPGRRLAHLWPNPVRHCQ
jgi:hypothetical protein